MTALLVNRAFQVFIISLSAIGALAALLTTGAIEKSTGESLLTAVIGFALGVPVSPVTAPLESPSPPQTPVSGGAA